ncbi:NADP-dependent oxidoreductase [Nocardia sp. NPDC006630]|uniref:NADP-dependent oxidoreductase n=1 Tax=Nocardia sp. NPDC006630 TaxID=3157181 RepID=UPI0033ACB65F
MGDRLYGLAWFPYPAGTYAEYLTVPAYHLAPMPRSASFVEAACFPMAALTAWQMLEAVEARAGRQVLISGASGGVGHLAVQLAVARGATVTALARPDHHATLHELGAHTCVDYTDPAAVTASGKFDAALDLVGFDFGASLFDHVTPGGAIALATAWSIEGYRDAAAQRGIRVASCLVEPDPIALATVSELVDSGAVRVVVGAEFDLSHAAEAQRWVKDRRGFGKAAIVVNTPERT